VYADHAFEYHGLGYGPLPLPPGSKAPPPAGWTGAEAPWPSSADVAAWCEEHPRSNLGLRLPAGVVGLDIDAHSGKPGGRTWQGLVGDLGDPGPSPLSTSRQDGVSGIGFWRLPQEDLRLRSPGPGIDLIHHGHRYAVVAPSVVEGRRYRWVSPLVAVADLPVLPGPWVDALTAPSATAAAGDLTPGDLTAGDPQVAATYASRYRARVSDGHGRHDSMVATLAWARREAEVGICPWPAAVTALHDAWQRTAAADPHRAGDPRAEWAAMVSWAEAHGGETALSASSTAMLRARDVWLRPTRSPQEAEEPAGGQEPRGEAPEAPEGSWGRLYTVSEVLERGEGASLGGWDLDGGRRVFERGAITLLSGHPGAGKTTLGIKAATHVAAGDPVLLVEVDTSWRILADRLRDLGLAGDGAPEVLTARPSAPRALDPTWRALLQRRWGAVVLDAATGLTRLEGRDDMVGQDVRAWIDELARPLANSGAAVVIIDHPRKAQPGEKRPEGPAGSLQKVAGVDAVYHLKALTPHGPTRAGTGAMVVLKDNIGSMAPQDVVRVDWTPGLGRTLSVALSLPEEAGWADDDTDDGATAGPTRKGEDPANLGALLLAMQEQAEDPRAWWTARRWRDLVVSFPLGKDPRMQLLAMGVDRGLIEARDGLYRLTSNNASGVAPI
jgi:hypothetical protein